MKRKSLRAVAEAVTVKVPWALTMQRKNLQVVVEAGVTDRYRGYRTTIWQIN